jgi:hypothetical protein
VNAGLATAIMIGCLAVGAWCLVAAARDRWVDPTHLVGLVVAEGALLVQAVLALVAIGRGERPAEFATFLGYAITSVLVLPIAVVMCLMERTRWGAVITGAAAVVAAVLVLRMRQVWAA